MTHAVLWAERLGSILPVAAQPAGPTTTEVGVVFIVLGVITCVTNRYQGRILSAFSSDFHASKSGRYWLLLVLGIMGIVVGAVMVIYGVAA